MKKLMLTSFAVIVFLFVGNNVSAQTAKKATATKTVAKAKPVQIKAADKKADKADKVEKKATKKTDKKSTKKNDSGKTERAIMEPGVKEKSQKKDKN